MSGGAVLVVDDHAGFRRVARRLLEGAGFVVAEAASGSDALAQPDLSQYDLVLLDIQLPDVDGFEVARRLATREQRPLVVLTSSRAASDYGPRVAASPVAGFVPKHELSGPLLRSMIGGAV
jgi:two-component system, NarL family, nitrate/nitrite response regulator NarL